MCCPGGGPPVLGSGRGILHAGGGAALAAANPKQELKASIDRVLDVLRDPSLKGDEHRKARRRKLSEIIQARFDFAEMGKRSLARQWRKMSPAEKKEFIGIFGNLLQDSYLTKIEAFADEKIVYPAERMEERYAEVKTRIVQKSGRASALITNFTGLRKVGASTTSSSKA